MTSPEPKTIEQLKAERDAARDAYDDACDASGTAYYAREAALEAIEDADKAATTLLNAFYDARDAQENPND